MNPIPNKRHHLVHGNIVIIRRFMFRPGKRVNNHDLSGTKKTIEKGSQ